MLGIFVFGVVLSRASGSVPENHTEWRRRVRRTSRIHANIRLAFYASDQDINFWGKATGSP